MLDHVNEKKCIVFEQDNKKEDNIWKVEASWSGKNCKNYIRDIVDNLNLQPNPEKSVIALSLGDPTIYGNLKPSKETIEALINVIQEGSYNGYAPCVGYEESRKAVADYLNYDGVSFKSNDIILCSGCSSSLEVCIMALGDQRKNSNILIPRPGFTIYRTIAQCIGINVKFYNLQQDNNWQIDLEHLQSQIDQNTAFIVLNNPSNPCGSVYSKEHLNKFLEIANKYKIPIIADEIYERIVFPESEKNYVSIASLNSSVPILICGGLAKRFLVPGWRLGWIAIYDKTGAFDIEIRKAINCLCQRTIGSNTLIQGALPNILKNTPQIYHDNVIKILSTNAKLAFNYLQKAPGLKPYMPEGTMYMMIQVKLDKFPIFNHCLEFVTKLMEEESVFCLPGDCFEIQGFMRIVLTTPENILQEACLRIIQFCNRHYE